MTAGFPVPAPETRSMCFSVCPSRNSMAMNRLPFVLANFVNGADIRMIQGRGSTRLTTEALQRLRVLRNVVGKKLQSDETSERSVFGLVDHTHATTAQLPDDAIVRNGLADHYWRIITGRAGKDGQRSGRFILRTRHLLVNESRVWAGVQFEAASKGRGFSCAVSRSAFSAD